MLIGIPSFTLRLSAPAALRQQRQQPARSLFHSLCDGGFTSTQRRSRRRLAAPTTSSRCLTRNHYSVTGAVAAAAAVAVKTAATARRVHEVAPMAHHPAALRNRDPIAEKLAELLDAGASLRALEIASGTGAHLEKFAATFPNIQWQPSEYVPPAEEGKELKTSEELAKVGKIGERNGMDELQTIDHFGSSKFDNVLPAVALDAMEPVSKWPAQVLANGKPTFDLVFVSNVFHITPFECTAGVFAGAGVVLKPGGLLVTYGPYKVDGKFTTESNEQFHHSLQSRNPLWGYRDVSECAAQGKKHGFVLKKVHEMPANNHLLEFVRVPSTHSGSAANVKDNTTSQSEAGDDSADACSAPNSADGKGGGETAEAKPTEATQ